MDTKCRVEYLTSFYADIAAVSKDLEEYPQKAARIFAKADKAILDLEKFPEMYQEYRYLPGYRCIIVEDYMVVYKYHKQIGLVNVHNLIYGGKNIPAHLKL